MTRKTEEGTELCPRKWAWRYVDGLEVPKHASAERGIRIHRHLELWFKQRVPPSGDEANRGAHED